MSESTKPEPQPLDDGRRGRENGAWAKFTGWFYDRLCGFAEFVGILIGIVGSVRQAMLAIGLAMLAGGLGETIQHWQRGPAWMFWGGLLIGLSVPPRWGNGRR